MTTTRPDSASSSSGSPTAAALQTPINRVRNHFHQCPVVYTDDPLELPQPVFPVTDFLTAVSSSIIEDIADSFLDTIEAAQRPLDKPTVLLGVANRSVGAIIHEISRRTNLPYSLSNWYPKGTAGEILVCEASGFAGSGAVYMNGLRAGDRVLLVVDLLRSGKNLSEMLRACSKAGCTVVGCLCVCEVMEHPGREAIRGFFDAQCPLHVLVQVSARGERTKVLGVDPAQLVSSPPKTASISRLCVDDVLAPNALARARNLFGYTAATASTNPETFHSQGPLSSYTPLSREQLTAKLKRVSEPFYNIPVVFNAKLGYPYCFWQLTDFVPLMTPEIIEDMADLCVRSANFNRCDVIVSEADRGGAPLAVALSRRTGKPFVLASWTTAVDSQVSDSTSVGFSGQGRFFISGVKNGERCIFVDDMLSSGGTACGVIESLARCGAVTLEALFIGEKLQAPPEREGPRRAAGYQGEALPVRGGFKRLAASYPEVQVSTLVQLTAYGDKTQPPVATVG